MTSWLASDALTLHWSRPWCLVVALLLSVPLGIVIYRRQRLVFANSEPAAAYFLTATRLVLFALLAILAAGPTLRQNVTETERPIVAFVVDDSRSMQLPAEDVAAASIDADGSTRSAAARRLLRAWRANGLTALSSRVMLVGYAGGERLEKWELDFLQDEFPPPPLVASPETRLGDAIAALLAQPQPPPLAAIVILTDGVNNAGVTLAAAARLAAREHVPIFPVPIGAALSSPEVSIDEVFAPPVVQLGDTGEATVRIESHAAAGLAVDVVLREGAIEQDRQRVVLQSGEPQSVVLRFPAASLGAHFYTIEVDDLPGEAEWARANNEATVAVEVSGRRLRVLLIDGWPRWDFRFLKNAARRDRGLGGLADDAAAIDILLEAEWRRLPIEARTQQHESLRQSLERYDAIALGDATPELLDAQMLASLRAAVVERGVGLLIASGPRAMPAAYASSLRELLPVVLTGPVREGDPAGDGDTARTGESRLELSPDGARHPALLFSADPERNRAVIASLPPLAWTAPAERLSPGGMALAWIGEDENRYGRIPLIARQTVGRGEVIWIGLDATWSWRANVGDLYFYRFWGQAIRSVARHDSESGPEIAITPRVASVGQPVQIEVRRPATTDKPSADPPVAVLVELPDGQSVRLEPQSPRGSASPAAYAFVPRRAGIYRVQIEGGDESATAGNARPRAEAFIATESSRELAQVQVDRAALERLAQATGGAVLDGGSLAELETRITAQPRTVQKERETSLWDQPWLLVAFALVYLIDIAVRRRSSEA